METATTPANPTARRRRRAMTVVAAAGTLVGGANPASAAMATWGGRPGCYAVGQVRASVVYDADRDGYYVSLTVDGPTIGRSPAYAGAQQVTVYTELWAYGSATGWRVNRTHQTQATVSNGTVRMWPVTFNSLSGGGYYFVRQYILWGNNWVRVDYSQPRDYQCYVPGWFRNVCTPYSYGYVQVHHVFRNGVVY